MPPFRPSFHDPSRREVVAGLAAVVAGGSVSLGRADAGREVARGYVFDDTGGSGARGPASAGVAGVMVSNGRDVVLTDKDGRWQLPIESGDSVFVIKPPGWSTPRGADGLPAFSHLHQPEGTPARYASQFDGVAPTGPLPPSIDFPLRRAADESDALRRRDWWRIRSPEARKSCPMCGIPFCRWYRRRAHLFAINHGDVVSDDLSLFRRYLTLLGTTGFPWHHCPGNHDMDLDAADEPRVRDMEARIRGAALCLPARRRHLLRPRQR